MPLILGMATVPSNSTVAVFALPPGYSNITVYQISGPQVYKGTSTRVSATNGLPVPNTPLSEESYVGSAGATMYATTGGAAASFYYIISSTG